MELRIEPGITLEGLTARPGEGCSEFTLAVVAVMEYNGRTYLVGYSGENGDRLGAYRVDRILSVDLAIVGTHEIELPEHTYVTGAAGYARFVECFEGKHNKIREALWKEFPLVKTLSGHVVTMIVPDPEPAEDPPVDEIDADTGEVTEEESE